MLKCCREQLPVLTFEGKRQSMQQFCVAHRRGHRDSIDPGSAKSLCAEVEIASEREIQPRE